MRSRRLWAAIVGVATFVIHSAIAAAFPVDPFRKYSVAAELFASGDLASERLVDFSPLYLAWFDVLRRIETAAGFANLAESLTGWVQIALTALSVALLFVLLDRRLPRSWALVGAAVSAFDRHVLVYERILEPEAFLLFIVTALLVLCDGPEGALERPLLAGAVGALGLAARPTLLPICLVLAAWPWLKPWIRPGHPAEDAAPTPRRLRRTLLFLAPVLLMLVTVSWRTAVATGSVGSPNMNPGTVFFEGNQPLSNGTSAIYPPSVSLLVEEGVRARTSDPDAAHSHYRAVARASDQATRTIAEVNGFWSSAARSYYADHPSQALSRLGKKWLYMFHGFAWHDLPAAWVYDRYLPVPGLPFAVLSALALLGLLACAREWDRHFTAYLLFATQAAVMTVFYVSPRQRLVWIPVLVYFALLGLRRILQEQGLRRAAALGLAALLALTFVLPDDAMRDERRRRDGMENARPVLGHIAQQLRSGVPVAALEDELVEALAATPWSLSHLQPAYLPRQGPSLEREIATRLASRDDADPFDLAEMSLRAGDLETARRIFESPADEGAVRFRRGKLPELPEYFLARIALLQGRTEDARRILGSALERSPGDPFVLAELAVLGDEGSRAQIERYFSAVDADRLIGQALLFHGNTSDSVEPLLRVADAFPSSRRDQLAAAAALHRSGRFDEAMARLLAADRLGAEPIHFHEDMASLYAASADRNPSPENLLAAAHGLFRYGKPELAGDLLNTSTPWPGELDSQRRRLATRVAAALVKR